MCQFSLIVRVILAKRDKPWKVHDLKNHFPTVWGIHNWRLIFLEKSFFHVLLHSVEDKALI